MDLKGIITNYENEIRKEIRELSTKMQAQKKMYREQKELCGEVLSLRDFICTLKYDFLTIYETFVIMDVKFEEEIKDVFEEEIKNVK